MTSRFDRTLLHPTTMPTSIAVRCSGYRHFSGDRPPFPMTAGNCESSPTCGATIRSDMAHRRNLLLQTASIAVLFPVVAQAHGEQIMAFPLSGFLAFLAALPIVLRVRVRPAVKALVIFLGLPAMVFLTWAVVIWWLNPTASNLAEGFVVYTVMMAVPPVLGCLFLVRLCRRMVSDKRL